MLGLLISLGETASNGIIVADPGLLHCVGPCTDKAGGVVAVTGAQVYFFDDKVPVGRAAGTGRAMPLAPGTNTVVAEKTLAFWTSRAQLEHAWPDVEEPAQSTQSQRVDIRIDPARIGFVVHIRLPRNDVRAKAYVDDGYALTSLVDLVAPLSIDGTWIDGARDLGRERMVLTSSTFVLDVRGSLPAAAGSHGEHRMFVGRYAENPIDLRVRLSGEAFARVNPFDRSPSLIAGLGDASWRHMKPGDAVIVRTELTAPLPLAQRARAIAFAVTGSRASPVLSFLTVAWQIVGILLTLRLLPGRGRRSLVRAAFAMTSLCTAVTASYVTVAIGSQFSGGAPPIVVLGIGLVAIGIVYGIANDAERRAIGRRPAIAIAAFFLLEYLGFRYEVALRYAPSNIEWLGYSFLPVATFVIATVAGLIALAPRLLVLAARLRAGPARAVYALIVSAIAITAAMWKPLYVGDASHFGLPIALGEPYAAGIEVLSYAFIIALPIVGILAFVCAAGLDRRAPHRIGYGSIVVLLALWCVGLDGPFLAFPPALIALVSIPLIALRPREQCESLASETFKAEGPGDLLFDQAVLRADLDVAARTQRQLREKFLGGDMDLATFNTRSSELAAFTSQESRKLLRISPAGRVTTMFTAFPLQRPLRAARLAACVGASIFALTAFVGFDSLKGSFGFASLSELFIASWILHLLARGALAAFVFVLFLPYLRGGTATTKGIFLSVAFLVASAPAALVLESSRNAATTLAIAALFFPVVGAVLDSLALVKHAASVSVMRVFSFANLGSIAVIGTVFVGAIASAVSGQLSQAAATFVVGAIHPPAAVSTLRGPTAVGGPPAREP